MSSADDNQWLGGDEGEGREESPNEGNGYFGFGRHLRIGTVLDECPCPESGTITHSYIEHPEVIRLLRVTIHIFPAPDSNALDIGVSSDGFVKTTFANYPIGTAITLRTIRRRIRDAVTRVFFD